jgi:flagellar biosynthesis/type III secretory pathway protein FliH
MTLARARIIKAAFADTNATTRPAPSGGVASSMPMGRRVAREIIDAHADAERIREAARADAARDAREEEVARLAAQFLALRHADEQRAERDLDRAVELAKILAERLVGEGLKLEPERIAGLAANALAETRGARNVQIAANPEDVAPLREALAAVGHGATVNADASLARGSLVVHTDLGTIDAQLRPQLDRLAKALREAMR